MMKNLQKNVRERMKISKISDTKMMKDSKNLERIEKRFEICY